MNVIYGEEYERFHICWMVRRTGRERESELGRGSKSRGGRYEA
jgi:hypothetical protein